jgi:predicted SnoaL-like aldol condensation-catalyzing enzyme
MSQKLENAKKLYLEGIRDGKIEAVKKYSGNRYIQHSTGVKDGTARWITADLFDTDENDKLIEHWDNMEPIPPREEWANSGKF